MLTSSLGHSISALIVGRQDNRSNAKVHPHDAMTLARALMNQHGLSDWKFAFDHARRRFGSCRYGAKLITLSRPLALLNGEQQVRDTLLHEIAHALTPGDGHGAKWKAACVRIGASPIRCYDDQSVRSPARRPARYRFGCRQCDWWVERRRRSRGKFVCARCRAGLVYLERSVV